MPIKLNLLAEAQAQEELRRKDPVKFATFGGILLVVLSLVWFSAVWLSLLTNKGLVSQLKSELAAHTNDFTTVKLNQRKTDDCQRRLDALDKLSNARFLQGQFLNGLQQIYVPNVAIIRVRLDQSFTVVDGVQTKGGRTPATATERGTLTIDAKDFSANPGDQINRYKDSFAKSEYFSTALQTNVVGLAGSPSVVQSGPDGKTFVQFTLQCRYPDKTR